MRSTSSSRARAPVIWSTGLTAALATDRMESLNRWTMQRNQMMTAEIQMEIQELHARGLPRSC